LGKLRPTTDHHRKANTLRIDDLSDAEFMNLQAEYGASLPICPICTLEDVRHLLLGLAAGDAVSEEVKNTLAPVLYAGTGALVTDRTMAEEGGGTALLGGDDDIDDDDAPPRVQ
jgi:hypothetical protein